MFWQHKKRVLLIGSTEPTALLAQPWLRRLSHVRIVGFCGWETELAPWPHGLNITWEALAQRPQWLVEQGIDEVMVVLSLHQQHGIDALMAVLRQVPVVVKIVVDFQAYVSMVGYVEKIGNHHVGLVVQGRPLRGLAALSKRSLDVLVAGLLVVGLSPLLLLLALLVRCSGPGPIFYRQQRISLAGRKFAMLKFRSMVVDAEAAQGAQMAQPQDPRCTWLGEGLRRFSLDELPQLFNVLKGDMSLVGPRPERPFFVEQFRQQIPDYSLRHQIKAGMTGLAQVCGLRGNTSIAKRIEVDLYYLKNWSLLLDIQILWRTLWGGFVSPK